MQQTAAAGGPPSELGPGTRVGHYEILGELGRGGMGVVYRARDATLRRDFAPKSPLPEQATEEHWRHFLIEARTASRLSHPSIVPIFEAFEDQGRPWLAMALAEGRALTFPIVSSRTTRRARSPPWFSRMKIAYT